MTGNKKIILPLLLIAVLFFTNNCQKPFEPEAAEQTGTIKITFVNTVKGTPMVLNSSTYSNPFAELYTISKLKYYVSNIGVSSVSGTFAEPESYHLTDASKPSSLSFSFKAPTDIFVSLSFMLGVDSLRNVSGAQTGALDPTNDMFWTWSTGYIMAKFEGNSPSSSQVNNKVEYHIGGFMGPDNVLRNISLPFPAGKVLDIREGKTSEIVIETDFDKWWQTPNDIKITVDPVCTTPGALAKKIADNYSKMFTITDVINN
jgi:hypothetical protein